MEEQEQYAPEEIPAESAEAQPEEIGEQPPEEPAEVEEVGEPTPPVAEDPKEKALLKAAQEERRKRQEMKQEAEYWRKVAMGEEENPVKAPEPTAKPKPEDFNDYDAYVEALTDYKAEQVFRRQQENTQKLTREQVAQREEQRLMAKAAKDAEAASKKYGDFQEVVAHVALSGESLKAMYQSEVGADIAYYLGKNPAELERITDLPLTRQIMELGKLETKILAKAANPEKKVSKTPTKVETAGNGFERPQTNLAQLREQAIKTGNWAKYLMEAGFIPD